MDECVDARPPASVRFATALDRVRRDYAFGRLARDLGDLYRRVAGSGGPR